MNILPFSIYSNHTPVIRVHGVSMRHLGVDSLIDGYLESCPHIYIRILIFLLKPPAHLTSNITQARASSKAWTKEAALFLDIIHNRCSTSVAVTSKVSLAILHLIGYFELHIFYVFCYSTLAQLECRVNEGLTSSLYAPLSLSHIPGQNTAVVADSHLHMPA